MDAKLKVLEQIDIFNREIRMLREMEQELSEEQERAKTTLSKDGKMGQWEWGFYYKLIENSYEIMLHQLNYIEYRRTFKKMIPIGEEMIEKLQELSQVTKELMDKHDLLLGNLDKLNVE